MIIIHLCILLLLADLYFTVDYKLYDDDDNAVLNLCLSYNVFRIYMHVSDKDIVYMMWMNFRLINFIVEYLYNFVKLPYTRI